MIGFVSHRQARRSTFIGLIFTPHYSYHIIMPAIDVSAPTKAKANYANGNGHAKVNDIANETDESMVGASSNDLSMFRQLVPLTNDKNLVFLNSSFSPPSNLIIHEAITKYASEALYDPRPKAKWQAAVKDARQLLARYINTDAANIAFTRDTTEALGSFIQGLHIRSGDNVVILDSEHPNHAYQWMSLRSRGLEVRQVPTMALARETGHVTAANAGTFAPFVDDRTIAIGLSSVMFHSGQWNDVADVCATFRHRGIHVVADITQQVGFAKVDVRAMGVSAAAFSLHKGLNCPTGLAALYVAPEVVGAVDPTPPIVGYGAVKNTRSDLLVPNDQIEYHHSARRYEHLNLSLIAAVAAKAYLTFYLDTLRPARVERHLYNLGDELRRGCASIGVKVVGPATHREHAPHLYVLDLHGSAWTDYLRDHGVVVTPYRLGIRVSFAFFNNFGDVRALIQVLRSGQEQGLSRPQE